MESMPAPARAVTVGVDTHLEVHVAAVVDQTGRLLGTQGFPASTHGYVALVTWAEGFGPVERIGIEGTGTFGAGLARATLAGVATVTPKTREGQVEMIRVLRVAAEAP
jgi:transposase